MNFDNNPIKACVIQAIFIVIQELKLGYQVATV